MLFFYRSGLMSVKNMIIIVKLAFKLIDISIVRKNRFTLTPRHVSSIWHQRPFKSPYTFISKIGIPGIVFECLVHTYHHYLHKVAVGKSTSKIMPLLYSVLILRHIFISILLTIVLVHFFFLYVCHSDSPIPFLGCLYTL